MARRAVVARRPAPHGGSVWMVAYTAHSEELPVVRTQGDVVLTTETRKAARAAARRIAQMRHVGSRIVVRDPVFVIHAGRNT